MIIAFEGIDGSGKTTLASNVEAQLLRQRIKTRRVLSGRYVVDKLSFLKSGNSIKPNKALSPRSNRTGRYNGDARITPAQLVLFLIFLPYVWATHLALKKEARSKVLLVDRYFWQMGFDIFRHNVSWVFALMPKPDVCFFLNLDVDISLARLDDDDRAVARNYYEQANEAMLGLANKSSVAKFVDATLPSSVAADYVVNSIVPFIPDKMRSG